jgi:hypothetical protein
MAIGGTNVSLASGIYNELNGGYGGDISFYNDCNAFSWPQGPSPGDNTVSYFAWGTKTGVDQDILYGPYNNGVTAGLTANYKFSYFKNTYGFFDQANFVLDLYIENNLPPAGRGDPPNDVDVDFGLYDQTLTSNSICPIGGNAAENGGTYGPSDVSQSFTFNVQYFYVSGGINCGGFANYNVDIYVNSSNEYSAGGLNGANSIDYTMFNTTPVNSGNGFNFEFYFS